jgi:hypothetical protein
MNNPRGVRGTRTPRVTGRTRQDVGSRNVAVLECGVNHAYWKHYGGQVPDLRGACSLSRSPLGEENHFTV